MCEPSECVPPYREPLVRATPPPSLLDLDGHWQSFDKIRILMGDEMSHRTRKALLVLVRKRAEERLDESIERDKEQDPFLSGLDAVLKALKSGQIECRVYNRDKFHAKAYITHGRFEVIGAQALVGSSNFTRPGLTQNVELNIKIESSSEVAQLQEWYEQHWDEAVDVSAGVVKVVERHAREYSPFDVYAQALRSMFDDLEPTASNWDQHHSADVPEAGSLPAGGVRGAREHRPSAHRGLSLRRCRAR